MKTFKEFISESKPTEEETWNKIKTLSVLALKGFARRIRVDLEGEDDEESIRGLIMDELFGEDWMSILMSKGLI